MNAIILLSGRPLELCYSSLYGRNPLGLIAVTAQQVDLIPSFGCVLSLATSPSGRKATAWPSGAHRGDHSFLSPFLLGGSLPSEFTIPHRRLRSCLHSFSIRFSLPLSSLGRVPLLTSSTSAGMAKYRNNSSAAPPSTLLTACNLPQRANS